MFPAAALHWSAASFVHNHAQRKEVHLPLLPLVACICGHSWERATLHSPLPLKICSPDMHTMLVWPQASSTEVTELFTNAAMTLTFFATDGEAKSVWGQQASDLP